MKIKIHRGAAQIGGSCVELTAAGYRLIVDVGLPLDADDPESDEILPSAEGLFTESQHSLPILGILISHPHQDHFGLVHRIRPGIPVYTTHAGQVLMESGEILSGHKMNVEWRHFQPFESFRIGPFRITPYLVDHSAFDACAFLIEANGKRVFYSGDFRAHGRKSKLFENMLQHPPQGIDALLMEGTMLGRTTEGVLTESELEDQFLEAIRQSEGAVLCTVSSQNVDRLVTIYRATKRSGRTLVLDLYTAIILDSIQSFAKLPHASNEFGQLQVWYPWALSSLVADRSGKELLYKFKPWKMERQDIHEHPEKYVLLVKPSYLNDVEKMDLQGGTYLYSQWSGYAAKSREQIFRRMLEQRRFSLRHLHTSGHATRDDLRSFVRAIQPKILIPMHTEHPEEYESLGGVSRIVHDGMELEI